MRVTRQHVLHAPQTRGSRGPAAPKIWRATTPPPRRRRRARCPARGRPRPPFRISGFCGFRVEVFKAGRGRMHTYRPPASSGPAGAHSPTSASTTSAMPCPWPSSSSTQRVQGFRVYEFLSRQWPEKHAQAPSLQCTSGRTSNPLATPSPRRRRRARCPGRGRPRRRPGAHCPGCQSPGCCRAASGSGPPHCPGRSPGSGWAPPRSSPPRLRPGTN